MSYVTSMTSYVSLQVAKLFERPSYQGVSLIEYQGLIAHSDSPIV